MSMVDTLLHQAEVAGLCFRIDGEQIVVRFPLIRRAELTPLIDTLKQHKEEVGKLLRNKQVPRLEMNWPTESLDAEQRFGKSHAKLFSFIGRKVRTPNGTGTLIQAFADRATVILDSEISRCSFFVPGQIQPVSWEL
jgi:hypothetical protein